METVATTAPPAGKSTSSPAWLPITVLASAQFVMVLDSSVMNVSISQIVADLDTTIQGVQLAITAYTLVMAALMLAGATMSSVDPSKTNEAGGLQGTAQNLGALLGTALIGSVLILSLTNGLLDRIEQNPAVPPAAREQVAQATASGIPVVPVADAEQAVLDAGVPAEQARAIADDYGVAQLFGLKQAIGAVAVFALLSLWFTRHLPGRPPPPDRRDEQQ